VLTSVGVDLAGRDNEHDDEGDNSEIC
jgi:hypothetical protein